MSETPAPFQVAVVQMDPRIEETEHNCLAILTQIEAQAAQGADLIVFPECALSGYVYESAAEARPAADTVPGRLSEALGSACARFGVHAIVGMLERDPSADTLYNSALLLGPHGLIACYRKTHLPVLGIDRYVGYGDALPVFDLPFARVGILICYDLRFPEAARTMALGGADLIVVPTNWPEGAESSPEFLTRARAWENRVYVAACNRVGVERGTRFIGRSQIVGPDGVFLAQADGESEIVLRATLDPARARQKKLIFSPGVFELDPIGGRRPHLYGHVAAAL